MIGAFIIYFMCISSIIFSVGLVFYITFYSIKHDTEDKNISITASIVLIVIIIGGILASLGI